MQKQLGDEAPMTPTFRRDYDDEYDHDHDSLHPVMRRSVLAKVKEKAKRWRQRLAKKKHGHDGGNPTPAWGVSLDEEDDDEWDETSTVYQSEMAANAYKKTSPEQHTSSQSSNAQIESHPSNGAVQKDDTEKSSEEARPEASMERSGSIKWLAGAAVSVILTPAYYIVSGATHMISSRGTASDETGAKEICDNDGVSVKDCDDKLEDKDGEADRKEKLLGDEEIREDVGVVGKVRGVVSSLIWRQREPSRPLSASVPTSHAGVEETCRMPQAITSR